jgi:hypothetical protein
MNNGLPIKKQLAITDNSLDYVLQLFFTQNYKDLGIMSTVREGDEITLSNSTGATFSTTFPKVSSLVYNTVQNDKKQFYLETRRKQDYYQPAGEITGDCDSRLNELALFGGGFLEKNEINKNGVITSSENFYIYEIDGIEYTTDLENNFTTFRLGSNVKTGLNELNMDNYFVVKEEIYNDISDVPSIENNIFVERSQYGVFQSVMKLSEIKSIENIDEYRFFDIY